MRYCYDCGLDQQCCVDSNTGYAEEFCQLDIFPVENFFERAEEIRTRYYQEILESLPNDILKQANPGHWRFQAILSQIKIQRGL